MQLRRTKFKDPKLRAIDMQEAVLESVGDEGGGHAFRGAISRWTLKKRVRGAISPVDTEGGR
jgi:hypothetical protein